MLLHPQPDVGRTAAMVSTEQGHSRSCWTPLLIISDRWPGWLELAAVGLLHNPPLVFWMNDCHPWCVHVVECCKLQNSTWERILKIDRNFKKVLAAGPSYFLRTSKREGSWVSPLFPFWFQIPCLTMCLTTYSVVGILQVVTPWIQHCSIVRSVTTDA